MCRKSLEGVDVTKYLPNVLFSQLLIKLFPTEMQEREKEEKEEKEDAKHKVMKKLLIGNRHEMVEVESDYNHHKWTFFIDNGDSENGDISEYVEKIVVNLHPTFNPPTLTLTTKPFQIARYGWGTFTIMAKIYFKDFLQKPPVSFSHYLSFGFGGSHSSHLVEFDRRNCSFLTKTPNSQNEPEVIEDDSELEDYHLSDPWEVEEEILINEVYDDEDDEDDDEGIIFFQISDSDEDDDLRLHLP